MENLIIQILLNIPELLFGFGLVFLIKRSLFVKNGQTTFAEVTEIQERQNTKMGVSSRAGHVRVVYHPVLKFEDDELKLICSMLIWMFQVMEKMYGMLIVYTLTASSVLESGMMGK